MGPVFIGTRFQEGALPAAADLGAAPIGPRARPAALTAFSTARNIFFQDTIAPLAYTVSNTASQTIGSITVDDGNSGFLDNSSAGGLETMTIGGSITVQGAIRSRSI